MQKVISDILVPAFALAVSSAIISLIFWLILTFWIGISFTYSQVFGVWFIAEMVLNRISYLFSK